MNVVILFPFVPFFIVFLNKPVEFTTFIVLGTLPDDILTIGAFTIGALVTGTVLLGCLREFVFLLRRSLLPFLLDNVAFFFRDMNFLASLTVF